MSLTKAIKAYIEMFDVGPPIWGLDEDAAIRLIEESLRTGKQLEPPEDPDIPPGALLSPGSLDPRIRDLKKST
ncbi:MAG: hypothetical protein KDI74_04920 [Gammaproteobacteria bacterium]|nr:hypothetical protein [Gammaproteobacteria bacterium]